MNAEFQRTAERDKKAFLSDQCKQIEETIGWERLEISSKKLEIPRKYFMQRWQREFCQKNTLVMANTLFQQQKRRLYTWTSPDGQHGNQIDYILCSQR